MGLAAVESMAGWEAMLATWRNLDVPEGYRAEISEGVIRMNPPPAGKHSIIADSVHWALRSHAPAGIGVFQTVAVEIAAAEKLYVPDAVAVPVKSIRDDGAVPSSEVLIAVEITSKSTATTDRQEKLLGYARGNVPAYLLIDRVRSSGPTLTLYTDPHGGEYQHVVQVPFGEPIRLPEPFGLDLDTADFPTD